MKYKTGDKFIIEIGSRINSQGLYKINKFDAFVLDDKGLDRLERIYEHDGCDGCRYEHLTGEQEPCESCRYNYTLKFEPKPEEIRVGDEIEYNGNGEEEKGIVIDKEHEKGRIWLRVITNQKAKYMFWSEELCHRTGRTYPELIKALEQLPKE